MAEDREQQRRNRRQTECADPFDMPERCIIEKTRTRRPDPCDERDLPDLCEIDRESFVEPTPPPPPMPEPFAAPDRVILKNTQQQAQCDPGEGYSALSTPVTVPAGHFNRRTTALVDFQAQLAVFNDLPGSADVGTVYYVEADDSYWVYSVDEEWESVKAHLAGTDPERLAEYNARVQEIQGELDEAALNAANAALDCFWTNLEITEECPDEEHVDTGDDRTNVVHTVDADVFRSYTSQQTADHQASLLAQSLLTCRYGHEEVTKSCEAAYPAEATRDTVPNAITVAFTEGEVSVEEPEYESGQNPDSVNGFFQLGTVTVTENTFLSVDSTSEATDQAEAQAIGLLNCLYLNDAVQATCAEDLEKDEAEEHNEIEDLITDGGLGNPVTVAADTLAELGDVITGKVNGVHAWTAVQAIAKELATNALECYWVNEEISGSTCPPDTTSLPDYADAENEGTLILGQYYYHKTNEVVYRILDPDGDVADQEELGEPNASEDESPVYTAPTIIGGVIRSYVSKADADDQAELIVDASLVCFYCNPELDERCRPGSELDFPENSRDATDIVPANRFCAPTISGALNQAESQASTPSRLRSVGVVCTYENNEIVASCVAGEEAPGTVHLFKEEDLSKVADPTAGDFKETYNQYFELIDGQTTEGDEEVAIRHSMEDPRDHTISIAEQQSITVAAGTIVISVDAENLPYPEGESPQTNADNLAELLALTLLNCPFQNRAIDAKCGFDFNTNDGIIDIGDGTMGPNDDPAHDDAMGAPDNPVKIKRGTFQDNTTGVAVEVKMGGIILAMLDCFVVNDAKTPEGDCPEGTTDADDPTNVTVDAGIIRSYASKNNANELAQNLANGLRTCISDAILGAGGAGDQGPSGNCDGQCVSFYS